MVYHKYLRLRALSEVKEHAVRYNLWDNSLQYSLKRSFNVSNKQSLVRNWIQRKDWSSKESRTMHTSAYEIGKMWAAAVASILFWRNQRQTKQNCSVSSLRILSVKKCQFIPSVTNLSGISMDTLCPLTALGVSASREPISQVKFSGTRRTCWAGEVGTHRRACSQFCLLACL